MHKYQQKFWTQQFLHKETKARKEAHRCLCSSHV